MSVIWKLIVGGLWKPILAVLGALVLYVKGRADAAAKAQSKAMKEDLKAHERINQADTGAGLDDDQRTERLRGFAAKHGSRPPKAGGR
jgi:hypothetical protein